MLANLAGAGYHRLCRCPAFPSRDSGRFLTGLVFGQSNPVDKEATAILEAKCIAGHGDIRMSDLDMRDTAAMLKGGKRAPLWYRATPG